MRSLCTFQRQPSQLLIKTHRPGAVSLHVRFLLLWDSFLAASCPTLCCAKCGFHPRHLNFSRTSPQTILALHAQVGAGCPWASEVSFLSGRSGSVPITCDGSQRIMVGLFGARFCSWMAVSPSCGCLACSACLVPVRRVCGRLPSSNWDSLSVLWKIQLSTGTKVWGVCTWWAMNGGPSFLTQMCVVSLFSDGIFGKKPCYHVDGRKSCGLDCACHVPWSRCDVLFYLIKKLVMLMAG